MAKNKNEKKLLKFYSKNKRNLTIKRNKNCNQITESGKLVHKCKPQYLIAENSQK